MVQRMTIPFTPEEADILKDATDNWGGTFSGFIQKIITKNIGPIPETVPESVPEPTKASKPVRKKVKLIRRRKK
jgi:hypothetical protein